MIMVQINGKLNCLFSEIATIHEVSHEPEYRSARLWSGLCSRFNFPGSWMSISEVLYVISAY